MNVAGRRIYISNLFRIRFWWFTLLGGGILGAIVSSITGASFLGIVVVVLVGIFWLTVQMACHACSRILSTTRLEGGPEICSHCQTPTDKGLAEAANK